MQETEARLGWGAVGGEGGVAESGLGAAVGGASGVNEEGRGSGRDGKIRFIFFIGWRGWWGCASNGTSLYFIYLQMEENENVF